MVCKVYDKRGDVEVRVTMKVLLKFLSSERVAVRRGSSSLGILSTISWDTSLDTAGL